MTKIKHIFAREILASGGAPSLEVDVVLENNCTGTASVSYGESAGSKEAFVLLDGDTKRYNGKGMLKATANVNEKLAPLLIGKVAEDQREIDKIMIEADGTENKSNFGANAILGVSMAIARASANNAKLELYEYLAHSYNLPTYNLQLPKPLAVFIEGGRHADNSTDLQEYILAVTKNQSAKANVQMMEEIYQATKTILKQQGFNTNVGNEGAFAPAGITSNELPLQILTEAIKQAGFKLLDDAGIYIDAAASEFLSDNKYSLKVDKKLLTSDEIIAMYADWFHKYPIVALEDGLSEFDWSNWPKLMSQAGKVKIVADDLTVTNAKLWQKAILGDVVVPPLDYATSGKFSEFLGGESEDFKSVTKNTLKGIYKTATRNTPVVGPIARTLGLTKEAQKWLFDDPTSTDLFIKTLNDKEKKEYEKIEKLRKERDKASKKATDTEKKEDIKQYEKLDEEYKDATDSKVYDKKLDWDEEKKKRRELILGK